MKRLMWKEIYLNEAAASIYVLITHPVSLLRQKWNTTFPFAGAFFHSKMMSYQFSCTILIGFQLDVRIISPHLSVKNMVKLFTRHVSTGMVNQLINLIIYPNLVENRQSQPLSNSMALYVAVMFSFFANAHWTFSSQVITILYMMYVCFIGTVAVMPGSYADCLKF